VVNNAKTKTTHVRTQILNAAAHVGSVVKNNAAAMEYVANGSWEKANQLMNISTYMLI
jgi:hypothetical protein